MKTNPEQLAKAVLVPTVLICAVGFYGAIIWTAVFSFTNSGMFPRYYFVGFDQYFRLFETNRWNVAYANMFVFGTLYILISLAVGSLLAVTLDQSIKGRSFFQSLFLYPIALSFIVTGLAWQWFLNPTTGLQSVMRSWGFESFTFDWLTRPDRALYTIVIAGVWHAAGLMMAIIFAGLQGIDKELWHVTRVDGIPRWRVYAQIILPMLKPVYLVCIVLLAMDVIKSYELIVAMTGGGPGYSTDVPAKFVVDHLFDRANIGRASAAAMVMMVSVLALLLCARLLDRSRGVK